MLLKYTSTASLSKKDHSMPKLHNSYFTTNEVKELLSLSEACYFLMQYYYQIHYTSFIPEDANLMTDEAVMKYTGWSLSKVKRTRLKLMSNGWVHRVKATRRIDRVSTETFVMTYLGKGAVKNNKSEALTYKEFVKINPKFVRGKEAQIKYRDYKAFFEKIDNTTSN